MCNIVAGYFLNSNGTDIPNCTVSPTAAVRLRCIVSFSGAEIGQQYYARLMAWMPDGSPYVYWTSNITAVANTIFSSPDLPISTATGLWQTYAFEVYQGIFPSGVFACSGYGTGSGQCETLTVGAALAGCTVNYVYFRRIGGTAIPNCASVANTDNIETVCTTTFTGALIGQQVIADIRIRDPAGATKEWTTSLTTSAASTTFSIPLRSYTGVTNPDGTLKPGAYSIVDALILDANYFEKCRGLGTGSGQCESITVTAPTACPKPLIAVGVS